MGSSGGRAKLGWAFLRSVVAQQQHRLSSSATPIAPIAPAATAPNRVGAPHWPLLRIGAPPLVLTRRQSSAAAAAASVSAIRDEANLTRPAAAVHVGIDHHQTAARKASWGSAWLFAAAGLMAFATTDLGNALPTTEENKTTDGGAKPVKKQRVVFVLGGPGSGKGTQCTKIVDNYGFLHLSAGDLLRAEIKSGSPNGNMIKSMIKEGKIVPSEVTVKLLDKAMNESKNDKFLIDGFPRNEENRAAFEKGTGISPEFILFFDCPEEVLEKRLLGRNEGRDDDNIETIRKRFKVFIESSVPVIDHYNTIGKVRKIDATKDKEEVFNAVEPLFKPFLSNSSCVGLTQEISNYTKTSVIQD